LDDDQGDYITTFARSTVMISDTSAIAYSYALTTGKPVIFFSKNDAAVKSIFKDVRYITDREKIGYCVDNTPALIDTLKQCFEGNGLPAVKRDFVTSLVFNRGYSFQYLVNHIDDMIEGRRVEGWWYLRDHL
jgi:CDP-glycerol glycerophosphotransferase (TagB/SpsB family)